MVVMNPLSTVWVAFVYRDVCYSIHYICCRYSELDAVEDKLKQAKNDYEEAKLSHRYLDRRTKQMEVDLTLSHDQLKSLEVCVNECITSHQAL